MEIIFFGNGARSIPCLNSIKSTKHNINAIVGHPRSESKWCDHLAGIAKRIEDTLFLSKRSKQETFRKRN